MTLRRRQFLRRLPVATAVAGLTTPWSACTRTPADPAADPAQLRIAMPQADPATIAPCRDLIRDTSALEALFS